MAEGKCLIFSAPSGAGKTTIVKYLLQCKLGLEFSVSATSRGKREHEVDGKDYYFLSPEDFKKKVSEDKFIEWEEVYTDTLYGTLKEEIERIWQLGKHVIFDVDVVGALNLKKVFGDKALAIFIMPPSVDALYERLNYRGTETPEIIQKRLGKAEKEMSKALEFDKVVLNDELDKAKEEALSVIQEFLAK